MTATCRTGRISESGGQCGCQTAAKPAAIPNHPVAQWTDGFLATPAGDIPRARARLGIRDHLGALRARLGLGRMRYRISPGLYAVGNPDRAAPVLVSANYKLSFDRLRGVLAGRDAWLLVLDTKGINVWCAAGKGTFGTAEIVGRVQAAALDRIVSHRKLVVPQLGAPGVAAHDVQKTTGFRVVYGPVRAADLPAFLDAGMKARPEMRRVGFRLRDRAVLIPVDLITGSRYPLLAAAALALIGGLSSEGYSLARLQTAGLLSAALLVASFLGAAILGPLLLPWLPGRPFALKGATLGLLLVGALAAYGLPGPGLFGSWLHLAAWVFITPTLASFVVMNFTGSSTYTSLSGVLLEMRFAVPAQVAGGVIGLGLWISGLFLNGGSVR